MNTLRALSGPPARALLLPFRPLEMQDPAQFAWTLPRIDISQCALLQSPRRLFVWQVNVVVVICGDLWRCLLLRAWLSQICLIYRKGR